LLDFEGPSVQSEDDRLFRRESVYMHRTNGGEVAFLAMAREA